MVYFSQSLKDRTTVALDSWSTGLCDPLLSCALHCTPTGADGGREESGRGGEEVLRERFS
jgi:hypothetical protein